MLPSILEIRDRHDYYYPRRDILCERLNVAIFALNQSVEKLESFSTRFNRKFFSIPLQCATEMRELCTLIQEGLLSEIVNFEDLISQSNSVRMLQLTQFNRMAEIADLELDRGGFIAGNIYSTYRKWSQIDGSITAAPYVINERRRGLFHLRFMEIFDVPTIDIFGPISYSEEFGVPEFFEEGEEDIYGVDPNDSEEEDDRRIGDSRSASPVDTDSELDDEEEVWYLPLEEAEFDLFEMYMDIIYVVEG
ncbi:hypothetical protein CAEBREN_23023 [Caenorhabditis brenneri]|uniref:Uncharacterized protein n=1 Tax=Caenorhabditis brenneri TaxID=135651 RepID=G0MXD8_CAEBE|nr:hypothetical protein CAEBREN_23023 [Caenorhabditis brenneri]